MASQTRNFLDRRRRPAFALRLHLLEALHNLERREGFIPCISISKVLAAPLALSHSRKPSLPRSAHRSSPITRHCSSNRYTAIRNPNNPRHFSHFQFSNRYKMRVLHPGCISGNACFHVLCLLASLSPSLCVSVPPWPIFAIMAGSN